MILRRKLLRDIWSRKGGFLAVAITIFLGLTLFAASYDAYLNLKESYQAMFEELSFADVTVVGGDVRAIAREASALEGVQAVHVRSVADLPLVMGGSHKLLGRAVGLPAEHQPAVNQVMILEGAYLDPAAPRTVLVEQHMAAHFNLEVGDNLEAMTAAGRQELTVGGVVASTEYLWPARSRQDFLTSPDDFGVVFVSESVLDKLHSPAVTPQVTVRFTSSADNDALEGEIAATAQRLGALDTFTREEQPSNALLQEDVQGFGELSLMFPILFLGAAGMATYILLTRMVYAQRMQIGLLLANGFRRRSAFLHYLSFGLAASLAGAIPGMLAGILGARVITGFYTGAISVPIQVIKLRPETILAGFAFALIAGALSALAPAMRAARMTPAEAMRGPMPSGRGGPALLERLLPPLRRLPAQAKMVLRGIGRNRRRSASTVTGVILALTLILTSWGMVDTIQFLLAQQFQVISRQDGQVFFTGPAQDTQVGSLEAISGVEAVELVSEQTVTLSGPNGNYETTLRAFQPETEMHGFLTPEGETTDLPAEGVLLGQALRDTLGVEEGDLVHIQMAGARRAIAGTVAGFVKEPLGTFAYMSIPSLQEGVGAREGNALSDSLVNSALLKYGPSAPREDLRSQIMDLPFITAYVDSDSLQSTVDSYMSLFYVFVGVMLAFGGVMAFALIFNTMAANISERQGEIAALAAAGVRRGRISMLITAENLLLTLLGTGPGLLIGYYLSVYFMASYTSDMFRFDLHMRPTTLVFSALAIVLVAMLSQRPLLRAVRRVEMAQVLRERSL